MFWIFVEILTFVCEIGKVGLMIVKEGLISDIVY